MDPAHVLAVSGARLDEFSDYGRAPCVHPLCGFVTTVHMDTSGGSFVSDRVSYFLKLEELTVVAAWVGSSGKSLQLRRKNPLMFLSVLKKKKATDVTFQSKSLVTSAVSAFTESSHVSCFLNETS